LFNIKNINKRIRDLVMGKIPEKFTSKWYGAENMYGELQAERMMPLFEEPMSTENLMDRLAEICKECYFFYPALLELGLLMIGTGDDLNGKKKMDKGLEYMLQYSDEEKIEDEGDIFLDNLIKFLRYDLAKEYAFQLIEKYPDVSIFYDTLSQCEAILGNEKEAIETIDKAIELKPESHHYHSNKGWYYLIFGNLDEAEKSLNQSLKLNKTNEITKGNIEVLNYLRKHGGNFVDFLLRPVDHELIRKYEEADENEGQDDYEDDISKLSRLYAQYNHDRMEALKLVLSSRETHVTPRLAYIIETLKLFLDFVDKQSLDYFLFDDVNYIQEDFLDIMYMFIVKFKDVDADLINDIYDGLTIFYSFLREREIVTNEEYQALIDTMNNEKKGIISKMKHYNKARSNPDITEEDMSALREELFDFDDFSMFF